MSDTNSEEMCDVRISREEIVKRFDLPERKTKINSILKLRKEQEQAVYCLCQSTDISTFMIGCEKCDEWYHGDCIGLDEKDAKLIKKWYCFDCIDKHGLKVVYFPHNNKKSSHKKKKEKKHRRRDERSKLRSGLNCGKCSNCLQNEECGNKNYMMLRKKLSKNTKCNHKEKFAVTNELTEDHARNLHKEKKRREKESRRMLAELEPKKCHGPGCAKMSRTNSKYCSDDCGLALAKIRIESILPHRIAQYQAYPSVAELLDRARLNDVREQKGCAFEELQKLDDKEKGLLELIERAKKLPIFECEEEIEDDSKMYCVTCGWDIPARSFMRHLESCFRKFETQTAVVGLTKSNTEHCHIFCDHYDAAKKTFCMRLRYVCPDHYKPPKGRDNEVCGCPVIKPLALNGFPYDTERFCQKSKKACTQHYNWESLALSDIDLDRQRQWNKLNALTEQEANIKKQLSNRTGALGLLLHSTEVH